MTDQEVYDTICAHLLKMKKRSMAPNKRAPDLNRPMCAYRGDGGASCAVGCLITDEEYSPAFEGLGGVRSLFRSGLAPARLKPHIDLLEHLQIIHDDPKNWNARGFKPCGRKLLLGLAGEQKLIPYAGLS